MATMTQSTACGITTVMVRNMPRKYTSWELVRELSRFFAVSEFDFVFVPWDKHGHCNMGLGFVNFRDGRGAAIAAQLMPGQEWRCTTYNRRIEVQDAHNQGLVENLRRYHENVSRRGCLVEKHAPIVLEDGEHLPIKVASGKYCLKPEANKYSAPEYPNYFIVQAFQARTSREEFFEDEKSTCDVSTNDWSPTASVASLPAFTEKFSPPPGLSASLAFDSFPAAATLSPPPGLSAAPSLNDFPFLACAKMAPPPPGLSASPTLDDWASIAGWDVPVLELIASYKGLIAF